MAQCVISTRDVWRVLIGSASFYAFCMDGCLFRTATRTKCDPSRNHLD